MEGEAIEYEEIEDGFVVDIRHIILKISNKRVVAATELKLKYLNFLHLNKLDLLL